MATATDQPASSRPADATDEILRQHLLDEFLYDPRLRGAAIEVAVAGGVVTLAGAAPSNAVRQAAARAAERIPGVRAVANGIVVQSHPHQVRHDTELAQAVARVLEWSALLAGTDLRARVEHGWVVLEGAVANAYQRWEAERAVHAILGVRGITNRIVVDRPAAPEPAASAIRSALRRQALGDGQDIEVVVAPDGVLLRGTVRSQDERVRAEETAWNANVATVYNHLTVRESAFG